MGKAFCQVTLITLRSRSQGDHSAFANALISELRANEGVVDSTSLYSRIRGPVMLAAEQAPELGDIRKAGQ